jgi:hypothetical protein
MSLASTSQNWIFAYQNVVCDVSFDWQLENHKSDFVQGRYELLIGGYRSCRRLPSWCNNFRAFFISLASSSPNQIFFYQNVAYDVSFDWQLEYYKSDTIRGRYELFTAGCRSCRWMPFGCNHFRVFFMSLASSSQNRIFSFPNVACDVSFDWQLQNHKSNTIRGSYDLFTGGRCCCR